MTLRVMHAEPEAHPDLDLERTMLNEAGFELILPSGPDDESLTEAGRAADALIVYSRTLEAGVIESLPALKLISCTSVGTDLVDHDVVRARGLWLANAPSESTIEVATHSFAMALSLIRHLPFYDRAVRGGGWSDTEPGPLRRPSNLVLGIAGLGAIGRKLAELALPVFQTIAGYDPFVSDWPPNIQRHASVEGLFETADVIALHLPLTEGTERLVDDQLLGCMRPGSYLVNAARGGIVDLQSLIRALDSGHLAGAALDVLPEEPPMATDAVLSHPRLLLSPHAAYYSLEAETGLRRMAVQNILEWQRTGRPLHTVIEGTEKDGQP